MAFIAFTERKQTILEGMNTAKQWDPLRAQQLQWRLVNHRSADHIWIVVNKDRQPPSTTSSQ